MVSTSAWPAIVRGSCKNLALNIRNFVLWDVVAQWMERRFETSARSFVNPTLPVSFYQVSKSGEVKYPTQGVNV